MTSTFEQRILEILEQPGGEWGIVVQKLAGEQPLYQRNPDKRFYAASVNKVAIALYVLSQTEQQRCNLDDRMSLQDASKLEGTGVLRLLDSGLDPTLKDVLTLMLIVSDNTAAKMLVRRFGVPAINEYLQSLGLEVTRLEELPEGKFSYGYTTPGEYAEIMTNILTGAYLSRESSDTLLEMLARNHFDFGLGRYLHDPIKFANKQGTLDDMRHEVACVMREDERYVISVFSENLPDEVYTVDNPAVLALAEVGKLFLQETEQNTM